MRYINSTIFSIVMTRIYSSNNAELTIIFFDCTNQADIDLGAVYLETYETM
jgi:hypothetical protein